MFTEKNGLEVLIIGKRVIIYDDEANRVMQERINSYEWEVQNDG